MKKVALLLSLAVSALAANAQYTLTGSSYTQNFDGIGSGLPAGWHIYSGSSATSLGTPETWNTIETFPSFLHSDSSCNALVLVGGFKNFPSADVSSMGDDYCATTPPSYTNRSLGVRQVSPTNTSHPNLDSGAAFVFEVANTTGATNFNLTYNLQSLDTSSPRTTRWQVDYGFGATPTSFTPATTTTGIFTTGGNTFSNNKDSVNFGTALDNKTGPVWIRVVTLIYSSGSGNRASSSIDDFKLTWTGALGVQDLSAQPAASLTVLGNASTDKITLGYNVEEEGTYALNIYDLTGRTVYTENITAQSGFQAMTINGLHIAPGMYIAKMTNGKASSVAKISVQ